MALGPADRTIPAITVPAWSAMMTGRDPSQLGFYGFRNRADHSYDRLTIANAAAVDHPRVWDVLSDHGARVGLPGVPQTFPVRPVNGEMVSCFLTPSAKGEYTYPHELRTEIDGWLGEEFLVDVPNFRSDDNEWLIDEGYLVLKDRPTDVTALEDCEIDWSRTRAWSSGGYYRRLFMNVRGREPEGTIDPADYDAVRDELVARLARITDPDGAPIGTIGYKPEELYREVRNVAPDLIIYFGHLKWRSVGSVGFNSIWTLENDTGPDGGNHAQEGIFIYRLGDRRDL